MAVINTEKADANVGCGGLQVVALKGLQVEDGCVGILHADAPSLHAGDSVEDAVILSTARVLEMATRVSDWEQASAKQGWAEGREMIFEAGGQAGDQGHDENR